VRIVDPGHDGDAWRPGRRREVRGNSVDTEHDAGLRDDMTKFVPGQEIAKIRDTCDPVRDLDRCAPLVGAGSRQNDIGVLRL
jgi:hypothetical protein